MEGDTGVGVAVHELEVELEVEVAVEFGQRAELKGAVEFKVAEEVMVGSVVQLSVDVG